MKFIALTGAFIAVLSVGGCQTTSEDIHSKSTAELKPLTAPKGPIHNRNTNTINQAVDDAKFVKNVADRFSGNGGGDSIVGKWLGNKAKDYARKNPDKVLRGTKKAIDYRLAKARRKDAELNRLLEEEDKILDAAYFKALRIGRNTSWKNPRLGSHGVIELSNRYRNERGQICYKVTSRANRAGRWQTLKAVACVVNGKWVTFT